MRRPTSSPTFATGIHDALLRSVAVSAVVEGVDVAGERAAFPGAGRDHDADASGSVRHFNVPPAAVSFTTMATVRPLDDATQGGNNSAVMRHNTGVSPEYLDENTLALPQHYSPGATSAAGLSHDARCVGHQAITCDACLGTGRGHWRACSYCGGSGVL